MDRRALLKLGLATTLGTSFAASTSQTGLASTRSSDKLQTAIDKALDFLVSKQTRVGCWVDESCLLYTSDAADE